MDAVMSANANRLALSIMPNANGRLYYTGNAEADGPYYPLYRRRAHAHRVRVPGRRHLVTGQSAGTRLRIGEA
jgi:hypothetical protein